MIDNSSVGVQFVPINLFYFFVGADQLYNASPTPSYNFVLSPSPSPSLSCPAHIITFITFSNPHSYPNFSLLLLYTFCVIHSLLGLFLSLWYSSLALDVFCYTNARLWNGSQIPVWVDWNSCRCFYPLVFFKLKLNIINIRTSFTSAPCVLQYHQDSCMIHQQVSLELAGWCGCPVFLSPQRQPASIHKAPNVPVWVFLSKGHMDG